MGLFLPSEGWDELQSFDCSSLEEDGTSFKVLTVRVWEATPAETEADVALYVGVFVAVAVFIVVVIAMVMLVRRIKGRDPCMYRGAGTGDGNCLIREISFCIYGSEDFHAEILEKVIQNITTRWGLLKDFTILKESVIYKEYVKSTMVVWCVPLIFMQYLKLEKVVAESLEAARWQGQC
ncbi:hypothetical protein AVEN_55415-1 [Araneus ventricosus]|uniref:Uncharacterized protein n=1 Tax=Araneus ventricosus TaxID=182803 RepID=A0A4Y2RTI1_ARAVE|nr:hypothetical protein AVEN_55415-1 [Araneus ventricosus]